MKKNEKMKKKNHDDRKIKSSMYLRKYFQINLWKVPQESWSKIDKYMYTMNV